ncbi:hypothetical protein MTsPCn5_22470 [Croceitalea sp. MTPC5]|uniref:hypothetical protein n=1 Tax=Croceitalea sp. MTPC5 TaxID=3056565 RepID=UPI002B3F9EB0|nr:hypothetical protein MTsPCn5_22470 [Croceitalea sp. MTPC5]
MSDMVKSGIFGLLTLVFWMLDAHLTKNVEQTDMEKSMNIRKEVTVDDKIVDPGLKGVKYLERKNTGAHL